MAKTGEKGSFEGMTSQRRKRELYQCYKQFQSVSVAATVGEYRLYMLWAATTGKQEQELNINTE